MTVLPNVLDDEIFHPDGGPRDPDELLFVGLIRRFKRLDVLLRALAEVRKHRPNIRLGSCRPRRSVMPPTGVRSMR